MRSRLLLAAAVLLVLPASHLSASVDLRVAPENLVVRPAGPYKVNQSIVIDVASRNAGDQAAQALLRLECVETGQILIEQRLQFPAGGFNTGQKGWIVPRSGSLTLRLSVNPDRAVVETDYNNNVVEKSITVQGPAPPPPPPLEIARINILPVPPSAGQPLLIQAEVIERLRGDLQPTSAACRRPAAGPRHEVDAPVLLPDPDPHRGPAGREGGDQRLEDADARDARPGDPRLRHGPEDAE
jgi:hypothetical protein